MINVKHDFLISNVEKTFSVSLFSRMMKKLGLAVSESCQTMLSSSYQEFYWFEKLLQILLNSNEKLKEEVEINA